MVKMVTHTKTRSFEISKLKNSLEKPQNPHEVTRVFFAWKFLFVLNEKFYPWMTTIRAFFPEIRALFSNFGKTERDTYLSSLLVTRFYL